MEQQLYCLNRPSARVTDVVPLLRQHAESFVQWATGATAGHGQEGLAHVTVQVGESDVRRQLRIEVECVRRARRQPSGSSAAMEAARSSPPLPRTDAPLEVVALSEQLSQRELIFFGSREPPAGAVGGTQSVYRVAEATVQQRAGRQP